MHINGKPVTTDDFVKAGLIKTPHDCPHPENYRTEYGVIVKCTLCGKEL